MAKRKRTTNPRVTSGHPSTMSRYDSNSLSSRALRELNEANELRRRREAVISLGAIPSLTPVKPRTSPTRDPRRRITNRYLDQIAIVATQSPHNLNRAAAAAHTRPTEVSAAAKRAKRICRQRAEKKAVIRATGKGGRNGATIYRRTERSKIRCK